MVLRRSGRRGVSRHIHFDGDIGVDAFMGDAGVSAFALARYFKSEVFGAAYWSIRKRLQHV
jgi:hypothetical protein